MLAYLQPALDMAANVAVMRTEGDGAWAWDRNRSPEDNSPLIAASLAYGLVKDPEEALRYTIAYEDNDILYV